MTVGFYHSGPRRTPHIRLAQLLIASVRRVMPDVPIVQMTAPGSVTIDGVDHVVVDPAGPIALARLRAYAACLGEWLFVDTDVIVQRDVRSVFERRFDVAVADRAGTLREKERGTKFMSTMPHNAGVVFSKTPAFWAAAVAVLERSSPKRQEWMGDQQAMCDVIAAGRFVVEVLPNTYNYPPFERDEDVRDKALVHYKGPRKAWLLERAA